MWAVAAVAVIFLLRKCADPRGCEVNVILGQLKLGGERETLLTSLVGVKTDWHKMHSEIN